MPDDAADDLACLALLYASGELDEAAAAAFERRLAEDQDAREALCQAVELNLTLAGQAPAPDPAYRQRVRQRLQQRRRHLRKLAGTPAFFGQPAMWAALGAAAATLLMLVLHHFASLSEKGPEPAAPRLAETPPLPKRDELERKIQETSAQAEALSRQLAAAGTEEERRQGEGKLRDLARELVDLDVQLLKVKVQELEQDLAGARAALTRLVDEHDRQVQKRYEELLDQAKKRKTAS